MDYRLFEYKATIATFAVAVPFAALVWLMAVPATIGGVTFVALALIALGGALIAVNTWRNGQATRNIDHLLNDTEAAKGKIE